MRVTGFIDYQKKMLQIFAKAWIDEIFKQRLLNNPQDILKEFGISIEANAKVHFHFDTANVFHLNLPLKIDEEELSEEQLKMVIGGMSDPAFGGMVGGVTVGAAVFGAVLA